MARSKNPLMQFNYNKKRWRRRVLVRILTFFGIVIAVLVLLGLWVRKALPGIAIAEISRLTNTRIETGAFDFHRNISVSIDRLVVRPEDEELFYDDTILRANNVYAKFSLGSVLLLSPRVTEIRIDDFILDAQWNLETGRWNVGGLRLNVSPGRGGAMPTVVLRQGKLRYCKVSGGETEVVTSVPIEADFGLSPTVGPDGYGFEIRTAAMSSGHSQSMLQGTWRPGQVELAGGLSSTDIPSLERAWAVDVLGADFKYDEDGNYSLELGAQEVHCKHAPEVDTFRALFPSSLSQSGPVATLQRLFARYRPLGTLESVRLSAAGNLNALNESQITGQIVCQDVSIRDRTFPYAIEHLSGNLDFTQSKIVMNGLRGRHGDVDIAIDGWTEGRGDERKYQYLVTSDNMVLDEDLYTALGPGQKRFWDAFEPSGVVGIDYRLTRSSILDRQRSVSVDLKGISATYAEFPYPLENVTGELRFGLETIIASDVRAVGDGHQVKIDGQVKAFDTETPNYLITIEANDIPLDEALGRALPARHQEFYSQFDPVGTVDAKVEVFTEVDGNDPGGLEILADVSFADASLKIEDLPSPITNVSAQASVTRDTLVIERSEGRYGPSEVSLTGNVRLTDDGRPHRYRLNVATKNTELDGGVIELLPESMKQPVLAFRPEGPIDLAVELDKPDGNEPVAYNVVVECLGDKINHELFAYPLHDVRGTMAIDEAGVTLKGISVKPELQSDPDLNPTLRLNGRVSLAGDDPGDASFTVQAKDILFTEALGKVLPETLGGIYRDLSPRGPFDVNFPMVTISQIGEDRRQVAFEGQVDLRTCSLDVSNAGTEMCGKLQLAAVYDTEEGLSQGSIHVAADTLLIKNKVITDLDADVIYDPNSGIWSADNFLGRCYEGRVLGNLDVIQAESGVLEYLVTVALHRVSLQPFLLAGKAGETVAKDYSSGTMNTALSLGARIGDGSSRLGLCQIHVADMQVGKVSPLANLLSVLSLTEPTDYTFEKMLIQSYIRRNKLLISEFDMSGRNAAFTGSGTVDLGDGDVHLILTGRGKRVASEGPSVLQSLTEGLGGAVSRIEVTGKLRDPKIETKALPVIEDSFKILGAPR